MECDPYIPDTTSQEEEVQDPIVSSSESGVVYSSATEDVYIPILDDEEEKNLPDPRLELIDRQFNLKMKELFGQASSEHLVPYNVEATLHHTATDMLKYLAKSHPLTWVTHPPLRFTREQTRVEYIRRCRLINTEGFQYKIPKTTVTRNTE